MFRKEFITKQGLVNLKNYKYKPGQYTPLDNILNPYWEAVVQLVPLTIAPNIITFTGWIFIIASVLNIFRYDYTGQAIIPNYCFFFLAIAVWTYSTLDAIDGKQARRTKSSSPLGQLFDHGCDSFSTTFFILAVGQVLRLNSQQMYIAFITSQLTFWAASWIEHTTGVLLTNIGGNFGISEGHVVCTLVFLLTGIFGQGMWDYRLMDLLPTFLQFKSSFILVQWSLNMKISSFLAYYISIPLNIVLLVSFFKTVLSSTNKLKPIMECFSFYFMIALEYTWLQLSIYDDYRSLIYTNFGFLGSLIICKAIISSVTKMQIQFFHLELIPLIFFTAILLLLQHFKLTTLQSYVFMLYIIINLSLTFYFLKNVINQISHCLGIYCFSLQKRQLIKNQ